MMAASSSDTRNRIFILFLVLTAGCVDAVGFKESGMFPANMTGNAVLLATALVSSKSFGLQPAIPPVLALFGFCLGVACASGLIQTVFAKSKRAPFLVLTGSGTLLTACGLLGLIESGSSFSALSLLLIAFAMGMQSAVALVLSVPGAGITTVITSTLTAAISTFITALRRLVFRDKNPDPLPVFPALVVVCYFGGALFGAWHPGVPAPAMVLLPGIFLGSFSLLASFFSKS